MKRRNKGELESMLAQDVAQLANYATTNLVGKRRDAWNMFLCRPRGDEIAGRSAVIDTTLRDHYHAMMSTIMPSFATDNIVQFEPYGPDDEDKADAESQAVNNIFTEDNSGYNELTAAVGDALLFRNGVIKVWIETETESIVQRFNPELSPEQAGLAVEESGWEVHSIDVTADSIDVSATKDTERLRVKSIEPSYFFVDPNAPDQDVNSHLRCGERVILRRGELVAMGISKAKVSQLDEITDYASPATQTTNSDTLAKNIDETPSYLSSSTWDEQLTDCFWLYRFVDNERWRFLMGAGGQILLLSDSVSFWPYASGSGFPIPHRWSGLSLFDLLEQTSNSKTNATRQLNDNLNVANNQRPIIDPKMTDMDSVVNGAPGRAILSKRPGEVGFMPFNDISSNSMQFLSYLDEVAGRQAGAALDLASPDAQALKDVSGISAEMQLGPKEMLASQIGRNLAESLVRQTFLLIHRVLREEFSGTITYRQTDEWVQADPSEWLPRNRINIVVGLSPGERRRKRAMLGEIISMQMQLIQGGTANITTSWKGVHAAITDWMRAGELDSSEGYFLDPEGRESLEAQQAQQQQAQAQQQADQVIQQLAVDMEQQTLELDKYKHDSDLQFKYFDARLDAQVKSEIEEAKLVVEGIKDVENADRG